VDPSPIKLYLNINQEPRNIVKRFKPIMRGQISVQSGTHYFAEVMSMINQPWKEKAAAGSNRSNTMKEMLDKRSLDKSRKDYPSSRFITYYGITINLHVTTYE